MQIHRLSIICDGARAALGRLDAADVPEITLGTQRLLMVSALFYTEALVPRDAEGSTRWFSIEGGSPGGEPWTYHTWIRIHGSEVYDVGAYTFKDHLTALLHAWERGSPFRPPEYLRLDRDARSTRYSSIWDPEPPMRIQFVRLAERVTHAMEMITRPCSRSACSLRLMLDGADVLSVASRAQADRLDSLARLSRMNAPV